MSGLLKKRIQVDESLGTVIGVPAGTAVSYAEIQKGLHRYIREHNLRTDTVEAETSVASQTAEPEAPDSESREVYCIFCGEAIPGGAVYCDLCGAMQ